MKNLVIITLALLPLNGWAQFDYATNATGITIFYYTGPGGDVWIPETVYDLPVTAIGPDAFNSAAAIISVHIPDTVTSIGEAAFIACTGLMDITIPDRVESIGRYCFFGCTGLTSVFIPESVFFIDDTPWGYCFGLTNIDVSTNNPAWSSRDGILYDKSQITIFQCPPAKTGGYVIPEEVTWIDKEAFNKSQLNSVTIPGGVSAITESAFYGANLTNVVIGEGTTSIGISAFQATKLTSVVIPASVTELKDSAFAIASLKSVYFRGNAPKLGYYVFDHTENATAYILPGTTGWENFPLHTETWMPELQAKAGVVNGQFGFAVNWAAGQTVVVEAFTNADWYPVSTNTLTADSLSFTDQARQPSCLYRVRSPMNLNNFQSAPGKSPVLIEDSIHAGDPSNGTE